MDGARDTGGDGPAAGRPETAAFPAHLRPGPTPYRPATWRRRRTALNLAGAALLTAMVAAQVASGLDPRPVRLVGVVVVLLAASALVFAAAAGSPGRAAGAFGAAAAAGYAAEWVGLRTGLPFGDYRYTDLLWPQVGGVPLIVALAWGGMGLAAHAVASAAAPVGVVSRVVLGALALTAWDLFLDPQMIRLGLWTWAQPGPYRGVPIGNFVGWFAVSLVVVVLVDRIARPAPAYGLAALYTVMAVMETVGFAAVFRPPDPLVAAAGGISMGVFALLAWRRRWLR